MAGCPEGFSRDVNGLFDYISRLLQMQEFIRLRMKKSNLNWFLKIRGTELCVNLTII